MEGANQPRQSPGDGDLGGGAEGHSRDVVQPGIEELEESGFQGQPGEVKHHHPGVFSDHPVQQRIGILHHPGWGPANSPTAL